MGESKIRVTTSGMTIIPYKKKQCPHLEAATSMKDFGCKFKRIEVTGYLLPDRFVTYHLPKFFLENYFTNYEIEMIPANPYTTILEDASFDVSSSIELRDDQYSVVNKILQDHRHKRWFVHCPTGFGKTLVAIYLISQFRMKSLIMCYSTEVLKQWRERFKKDTNINMRRILLIDDGQILKDILDGTFPVEEYDVFLATPILIVTFAKKNSFDSLNELFKRMKIGIKVYDEAHRHLGNMIKIDASTSVKHTLYLSGDFAQAGQYKTVLFHKMFHDVVKVEPSMEETPDLKYTQAIIVEYDSHPTELETLQMINRRGMSVWDFMDYQIKKGVLVKVIDWIINHILKLNETNRRILVLTSKIDHCEYLYQHIKDLNPNKLVGMYHGEMDPDEMKLTKENASIIVATYSSFSTGIDTPNIKYVISTSASNRIEDNQASGRARRISDDEDCFFWMLVDTGFEKIKNKEKTRIDYLYQLKVKEVHKIVFDRVQ